jgi:hypothetical protein
MLIFKIGGTELEPSVGILFFNGVLSVATYYGQLSPLRFPVSDQDGIFDHHEPNLLSTFGLTSSDASFRSFGSIPITAFGFSCCSLMNSPSDTLHLAVSWCLVGTNRFQRTPAIYEQQLLCALSLL